MQDPPGCIKKNPVFCCRYDMRQTNNSDYTFKVANRAYFDETVNLTGCVGDILKNELQIVDFTHVSFFFLSFVSVLLSVCSSICLVFIFFVFIMYFRQFGSY